MINLDDIFNDYAGHIGAWVGDTISQTDLAGASEYVLTHDINFMSVASDMVGTVWPWLEKSHVKIMPRFYVSDIKNPMDSVAKLSGEINSAMKHGASGAQIFTRVSDLSSLTGALHCVRDDLFFNRDLALALDLSDINAVDWGGVFGNLKRLRSDMLVLILGRDTGDKSDFVGRIYGMLNAIGDDCEMDICFALGNIPARIEQTWRLIQKIKPGLTNQIKFLINI